MGNSAAVAREHYLQVTDEHFDLATKKGAQHGAASGRTERMDSRDAEAFAENYEKAAISAADELLSVGPVGLEPTTNLPGKTGHITADGAESGAIDADLARIIATWPTLPEPVRRAIRFLVDGCGDDLTSTKGL